MSVSRLAIFLLLLPGVFVVTWPVQGQTSKKAGPPGAEVFGGFSYLHSNYSSGASTDLPSGPGFNFGAGFDVYRPVWFVAKISMFRFGPGNGSTPHENTFLFGPEVSIPVPTSPRFTPFAGLLIGGSTYNNSGSERDGYEYNNNYSFAYDFEGGVDYGLTPRFAIRGAVGYVHSTLAPYRTLIGFVPAGYGREQFDVDLVYRF